ncbi:MAG TPA: hypothetical protein VIV55_09930 [Flavobacterium sp.]
MNWYILKGKIPEKVGWEEYLNWGYNGGNTKVDRTDIGNILVSTVFLGIDHSFRSDVPILFETMIFGGELEGYQERYSTWDEAVKGHKRACDRVLKEFSLKTETLRKVVIDGLN